MLRDLDHFFAGISVPGVFALLAVGFLAGTALHEYTMLAIRAARGWYAGRHD